MFACVSMAPFSLPVVPLVKRMEAMSCSELGIRLYVFFAFRVEMLGNDSLSPRSVEHPFNSLNHSFRVSSASRTFYQQKYTRHSQSC